MSNFSQNDAKSQSKKPQSQTPRQIELSIKITLDYKQDVELFDKTAQKIADEIAAYPSMGASQIRKFYDYILDLCEKSETKDFSEILPFVKMLNSKVNYAKERKHANDKFAEMIKQCVAQVNSKEKLQIFKLFFEAVLGFSKGK